MRPSGFIYNDSRSSIFKNENYGKIGPRSLTSHSFKGDKLIYWEYKVNLLYLPKRSLTEELRPALVVGPRQPCRMLSIEL